MASDSGGSRPVLGGLFLVLGSAAVTAAFLPGVASALPGEAPTLAGVQGEVLAVASGGLLLVAVGTQFLRSGSTPTDAGPSKELRSTEGRGKKRTQHPSTSPTGTTVDRSGTVDEGPRSEEEQRMDDLESQIKAIDKRMSQAKVKLGTGELSPEGYQKVMEELEEKRAQLEKQRVDLELDQSDI